MLAGVAMALALTQAATAGRGMLVGAAEDSPEQPDLTMAVTKMDLARIGGLGAIRLTAQWLPGRTAPTDQELADLQNATDAAALDGIEVYLSVFQPGSRTTPRTSRARRQFAAFTASLARTLPTVHRIIVGNEPNLNRFWLPQFRGNHSVAPAAYEKLLATTYDALKRVSPRITVIGGALSPRGGDDPHASTPTHSPTRFILELGKAYRASGRKRPIMDAFSLHPYPANSAQSPTKRHPHSTTITMGDYDKLTRLLGRAFHGTAQPGASLPIIYAEFGVQSRIPADKEDVYTNQDVPASADAVSEALQARYYREALALAYCQPTVRGFLIFHVEDESDLGRWQSGLYYADDTPKSSLPAVRAAVIATRDGTIARCGRRSS
jgi:hypothetical protein